MKNKYKTYPFLLVWNFPQVHISTWHSALHIFLLITVFCYGMSWLQVDYVKLDFDIEIKNWWSGGTSECLCVSKHTVTNIGFLLHCSPVSKWNWLVTICYFSFIRIPLHLSLLQSPCPWCSYITIYWQLMKSVFGSLLCVCIWMCLKKRHMGHRHAKCLATGKFFCKCNRNAAVLCQCKHNCNDIYVGPELALYCA